MSAATSSTSLPPRGPGAAIVERQSNVDGFLSTLEDVLREDRHRGRLVQSLSDFAQVVSRVICKTGSDGQQVLRGHDGKYAVALPDGTVKADSSNPGGEWEQFEIVPAQQEGQEGKVLIKTHHRKYLSASPSGALTADLVEPEGNSQLFELVPSSPGKVVIRSFHGQYLISLPDGSLQACSSNPDMDWEQFEIFAWKRDIIMDRDTLFSHLDQLSENGRRFGTLTYVVNEWALGGVVKMRHHACILAEAGPEWGRRGRRYLKFDFGRWGVGWSFLEEFPDNPKGTFLVRTFKIPGDPQKVKAFCAQVRPFSWTTNNCATFSRGLIQELAPAGPALSDSWPEFWPEWSHCLGFPLVQAPKPKPEAAQCSP